MSEKRKPITWQMKQNCFLQFGMIDCYLCGQRIGPAHTVEWDHLHALVHDGPHIWENLRPVHAFCHKAKTARDIKANAKVKRTPESKAVKASNAENQRP